MKFSKIKKSQNLSVIGGFYDRLKTMLGHDSSLALIPETEDFYELMTSGMEDWYIDFIRKTKPNEASGHTFDKWNDKRKNLYLASADLKKAYMSKAKNQIIRYCEADKMILESKIKDETEFQRYLSMTEKGDCNYD